MNANHRYANQKDSCLCPGAGRKVKLGTEMGAKPQPAKETDPRAIHCLLSLPASGVEGVPGVIRSLDRWGAVLRFPGLTGSPVAPEEPVQIDVALPAGRSREGRALRCEGTVTNVSRAVDGHCWLVVRFHQVQFSRPSLAALRESVNASLPGCGRDPEIVEESGSGPQGPMSGRSKDGR